MSKLDQFDTRLLSVDRNTPLARALNARMTEDPFLRDFGRDDTLNDRDNSTQTREYLNQKFKPANQQYFNEDVENYHALTPYEKEKLSYKQYNKANLG